MPDYTKTIIYKLINYDCPDLVYVGSTTNFTKRKSQHKRYSEVKTIKLYETIRNNGGWESWTMIKICDYPCLSNIEARQEEDKHMIELKANLNSQRAERSNKQYREDNKEQLKQYKKDNKDKILEQAKQYRIDNIDKINKYKKDNKDKMLERAKQLYQENKEKILERKKKYRIDNKEKIAEKAKQYRIDNKEKIAEQQKRYHDKKLLNAIGIDKTS